MSRSCAAGRVITCVEHPRAAVLVVEVAESSLDYDRRDKALLYARAGFADYWIVNLIDRRIEVHRDPAPTGYRSVVSLAPGDEVAPLAAPAARSPSPPCFPSRRLADRGS